MSHILKCHDIAKTDFVRAENCYLYDEHGRRYIDLESGIWCTAIGHSHPRISQVIAEQASRLMHLGTRYPNTIVEETALSVLAITQTGDGKCTFLSSGSEAVEFGVQAIRRVTGKNLLINFFYFLSGSLWLFWQKTKGGMDFVGLDWLLIKRELSCRYSL